MSEKLAEAYLSLTSRGLPKISADLGRARDELSRFVGVGNKSAASIQGAFQRMSESAAGFAAGAAITSIIGKMKQLGSAIIGATSSMEDYTVEITQMMKMGGAADPLAAAKSLMADITELSAATPFEMPELVKGAKDLLKWGFAADEVIDRLRTIGDAAAGNENMGEAMNGIILALGQMKSKGMASTQEMNQLIERGVPAWEHLAKSIGVSVDEAQKQVESKTISSAKAISAIMAGIQGSFGGLMEAKSKTLTGKISTMKDNIGAAFRELGGQILEPMKGAIDQVSTLFSSSGFLTFARQVGAVMAAGAQMAWDAFQKLYATVAPILSSVVNAFGGWGAVLRGVGVAILAGAVPAIATFAATMAPVIAIGAAIAGVWSAFIDRFGPALAAAAAWAGSAFAAIGEYIQTTIMPAVSTVIAFVNECINNMILVWWGFYDTAVEVWNGVSETISGVIGWLSGAWSQLWTWIDGVTDGWANGFIGKFWAAIRGAYDTFIFLMANVGLVFSTMMLQAQEWGVHTMDIFHWLATNAFVVWDNFPAVISSVFGAAWQIISNFGNNIWELFKAIAEQIKSGFTADWSPAFRGLTDGVSEQLKKLPEFAKLELTDFGKEWDRNQQQWDKAKTKFDERKNLIAGQKFEPPKAIADAIVAATSKKDEKKVALPGAKPTTGDGTTKKEANTGIADIVSAWTKMQESALNNKETPVVNAVERGNMLMQKANQHLGEIAKRKPGWA